MGALSNFRVLDLTRILAGPIASQTLADLGAEVIKIERPATGDDTRGWGPPYLKDGDGNDTGETTYFACANRGKKSVTVNLSTSQGQELVRRLAAQSHVFLENYKVGTLKRYGLGYEDLKSVNPALVYCSITGYGQTGPYRSRAGYDPIAQAMGGLMSVTGERDELPGGGPQRAGVAVTDLMTGLYSAIAIVSALLHQQRTGEGQHIDVALLDVQVAGMANIAQDYLGAGVVAKRIGSAHPSVVPSQIFRCEDGRVMLTAGNDGQFSKLCEVLGRVEVATDPRFSTNDARAQNRQILIPVLEKILATRPVAFWTGRLADAGVPCGPINNIAEVFEDTQVVSRGMQVKVPHALVGQVSLVASPMRLAKTPVEYHLPPPLLGEHTEEVLGGLLGMGMPEIQRLRELNVI